MKTGKGSGVRSQESGDGMDAVISVPADTVESLRAHVNRLHAERGATVLEAKKAREEQGVTSAAFQLDWAHVENLTSAIVHYEAELGKALEADASIADQDREKTVPLLRDPSVEMPDSDITVFAMLKDADYPVWPAYHDGELWWAADGSDLCATCAGDVTGWMHMDEAADILKQAKRKAVAHA